MSQVQLEGITDDPEARAFYKEYSVRNGVEDWDVLEEEKWSAYKRLESFRRMVAWWRGENWRGYNSYIGAPILYDGNSQQTIEKVVASANTQRKIQAIAQQRATALVSRVRDGQISPEYVRAYIKNANLDGEPVVDLYAARSSKPLRYFLNEEPGKGVPDTQRFYTLMRTRIEKDLVAKTRAIMEASAARMDSYVALLTAAKGLRGSAARL